MAWHVVYICKLLPLVLYNSYQIIVSASVVRFGTGSGVHSASKCRQWHAGALHITAAFLYTRRFHAMLYYLPLRKSHLLLEAFRHSSISPQNCQFSKMMHKSFWHMFWEMKFGYRQIKFSRVTGASGSELTFCILYIKRECAYRMWSRSFLVMSCHSVGQG